MVKKIVCSVSSVFCVTSCSVGGFLHAHEDFNGAGEFVIAGIVFLFIAVGTLAYIVDRSGK